MGEGKIIGISLIIALLIPTISNGLEYHFKIPSYEHKPMVLKKWTDLELVFDMKQVGDTLYTIIMRGIQISKINLHTYNWKNVAEFPLLQCLDKIFLLKYKNHIYTVLYGLGDVDIYKIGEEYGTMILEHRYSGVTLANPLESGTLTVVSHTPTQRICFYNLEMPCRIKGEKT